MPKPLLTLAEVAAILRVDQNDLRRLARRGKIPGAVILPNGCVRFDPEALETWLRQQWGQAKGARR